MQKKYVVREEARVDPGKEGGVGQGERVFGRGGAGEAVGYWQDDLHTNIALHEEGPTVCSAPASCTGYWIGHNCP